jgi:VanZ like family
MTISMTMKWTAVLAFLVWCSLIAITSNTVVRPHDFFAWMGSHVFTDQASFHRFVVFWGYSWFVIVKSWHVAEFAILCSLTLMFLTRVARSTPFRNILLSVLFCTAFALADEYHQTYVPGRGGTWTDVGIDCIGILSVCMVALIRSRRRSSAMLTTTFLEHSHVGTQPRTQDDAFIDHDD